MTIFSGLFFSCCFLSLVMGELLLHPKTVAETMQSNAGKLHGGRKGKLFPVFQVVRFSNDPCAGNNGRNGSCYTNQECSVRKGKIGGTCANGYGVCCTFDNGCGSTSSQNCTYFVSPDSVTAPGVCQLKVCPSSDNICQLRLDFVQFGISGPSTNTIVVGDALFNNLVPATSAIGGRPVLTSGQCLTDTFSVSNPGGGSPPVICGTNTGQHLYVDASDCCNKLTFQLGSAATATTTRVWNIKITQYSCDYNNLAPSGCTQYFFGTNSTSVQSFNFNGGNGQQLANQDQKICVRRERGNCRICWYEPSANDFSVSGIGTALAKLPLGFNNPAICCAYGSKGAATGGYDCVSIPLAQKSSNILPISQRRLNSRFCGMMLVSSNALLLGTVKSATVCSTDSPFYIRGVTDQYENMIENMGKANVGFSLAYTMDSVGCSSSSTTTG